MKTTRLEELQKFLEQEPNDSFTRYAIAMEYVAKKENSLAIKTLEDLIEIDSMYLPAFYQLGTLLLNAERFEHAIKILEQGISLAQKLGEQHTVQEMEELIDDIMDEME